MGKSNDDKKPLLSSINDDDDEFFDPDSKPILIMQKSKFEMVKEKIKGALTRETLQILLYVVLYISAGVVNSILLKKVMNVFSNYAFFLNQLTNYGYVPIFFSVVLFKFIFTNDIPKETRSFPTYKFAIMGALDAVAGYFVVIGGISTSGPLQQLLNQAIIPFTMLASFLILKERYSLVQMGGATVIVGGVIVSLIPSLIGGGNSGNKPFWNVFYLISVIPSALSNVYKDIGFKAVEDMDVWYLQFWDAFYQSLIGTVLFPINNWLPPPATIHFKDIIPSLKNGTLCLGGHDSILPVWNDTNPFHNTTLPGSCTPYPIEYPDLTPCDDCHHAYILIICYMTINIIYNVLILLVIKHAGATVFSIANTLRLPITNIVFSLKFIMGINSTPFSSLSIAGLIIILLGLGGYRAGSILKAKKAAAEAGGEISTKTILHMGPSGMDAMPYQKPIIQPKSQDHLRNQFFNRLGISVPEARYRSSPSYGVKNYNLNDDGDDV